LVAIEETSEIKENNSNENEYEMKVNDKPRKESKNSNRNSKNKSHESGDKKEMEKQINYDDQLTQYIDKNDINKNNFSNSTDELFAHLNNKIDNLNNTNLTGIGYSFIHNNQPHDYYNHDNFYNQNNLNTINIYNQAPFTKFEIPKNENKYPLKDYNINSNNINTINPIFSKNNNFQNNVNFSSNNFKNVSNFSMKNFQSPSTFSNNNLHPSNFENFKNNIYTENNNLNFSEKNFNNKSNLSNNKVQYLINQNINHTQKNNNIGNNDFYMQNNPDLCSRVVTNLLNTNRFINNNLSFNLRTHQTLSPKNFNNSNIENKTKQSTNYSELRDDELAKIAGIICKDQTGCRLIQKKIMDNSNFADKVLFPEIQDCLLDLINDAFGNYLIQKMLDFISLEKIEWILNLISPCFFEISCSPHGTRVIQKLIEVLYNEKIFTIFNSLFLFNFMRIAKDVNANHIVHKYVLYIKFPFNQDLYDLINRNFVELSKDKHGCCVMQKVIEGGNCEQKVSYYFHKIY
jgi:hypothetical protein